MFRNKYTTAPRDAIADVLDPNKRVNCATVMFDVLGGGSFGIEYLNHPEEPDNYYNVTNRGGPVEIDGLTVEEDGDVYTLYVTLSESGSEVEAEMKKLATAYVGGESGFEVEGAHTKTVPRSDATAGEIFCDLVKRYNPLGDWP